MLRWAHNAATRVVNQRTRYLVRVQVYKTQKMLGNDSAVSILHTRFMQSECLVLNENTPLDPQLVMRANERDV